MGSSIAMRAACIPFPTPTKKLLSYYRVESLLRASSVFCFSALDAFGITLIRK
jgi:hypothetical protein